MWLSCVNQTETEPCMRQNLLEGTTTQRLITTMHSHCKEVKAKCDNDSIHGNQSFDFIHAAICAKLI